MSSISQVFTELFYGSGAWLGILLLLTIIISLSAKIKYAGVLTLPIVVFLGIDYITNDLLWNAVIMFFASIFIVISLVKHDDG